MNRFIIVITLLAGLLVVSCSSHNKDDRILMAQITENFDQSTRQFMLVSREKLHSIADQLLEDCSAEKAKRWYPKAEKIDSLSQDLLQMLLEKTSSKKMVPAEITAIRHKLLVYRDSVLASDSLIRENFAANFNFVNQYDSAFFITPGNGSNDIKKDISLNALSTYFHLLTNQVARTELILLAFFVVHINCSEDNFYRTELIVGQSSQHLQPGEKLTVTAGLGNFSSKNIQRIQLDGHEIKLGENGLATLSIVAPDKPGTYTVPVIINYLDLLTDKPVEKKVLVHYQVDTP